MTALAGLDPSLLALLGGGSALNAVGGLLGGQSANRAARQQRDFFDRRTDEGYNRLGFSFFGYGPDQALKTSANLGLNLSPEQRAAYAGQFNDAIGGPIFDQLRGLGPLASSLQGQALGQFGSETDRLTGLTNSILRDRAGALSSGANALLGSFDRGAQNVTDLAGGLSRTAAQYGQGRERVIREDSRDLQNSLDSQTRGLLAASGFGGTVEADQLRANARQSSEVRDRALTDLNLGQTDRALGALGQRVGLAQQLLGARSGLASGLFGQAQDQLASIQSQGLAGQFGRGQTLAPFQFADVDRQAGFAQLAPLTALNVLQGPVANPYLGQLGAIPASGVSGAGNALGSLGNAGAGLGSILLGSNLQQNLLSQAYQPSGGGGISRAYWNLPASQQFSPRN